MSAFPARTTLADTYPNPSNAVFRTGIGEFYDATTGLLGTTGNQAEARDLLGIGGMQQYRLTKSGANLLLSRYGGKFLTVNNVNCAIPAAGVTLAPTGAVSGTSYFVYATAAAGVVTGLEFSATGYVIDTTSGVPVKSSDPTRTLVGLVRAVGGPAWSDIAAQRFVISWANRRPIRCFATSASAVNIATSAPTPIIPFMEFLTWGDSCVSAQLAATVTNTTANALTFTGLALDSNTTISMPALVFQAYAGTASGYAAGGKVFELAEGYHYIYTLGYVSGGTGTWSAGLEHNAVIQG
ncbi:hypothetical protein ABIC94_002155 [Variovorax paradoxus]|uniref:hypothetical protein n=1 Tax=Variovorax paradoxus TaxID=34073 RepID=UPI0033911DB6